MYHRRIDLNLIIGAQPQELTQLSEQLDHDELYERATEYMKVVHTLLASGEDKPLTHDGRFYQYRALRMGHRLDPALWPRTFVAGSSPAAQRTADAVADVMLTHPEPVEQFAETYRRPAGDPRRLAIRVGLLGRATDEEAWSVARALYPENRRSRLKTDFRKRSPSDWSRRMAHLATEDGVYDEVYWTGAYRADKGNMPLLVGDYGKVADYLERYLKVGVSTLILASAMSDEDLEHASAVLSDLRSRG
jgi:alkanesulfonate monooxygenase SsuD/methylene tetrahydromethanopterin reductase-like flavin-dependent oxidoreductase (luciferase family)